MFDILKNKTAFKSIVLACLPLTAVTNKVLPSIIAAVILLLSATLTSLASSCLERLLCNKALLFARLIISAGVVGIVAPLLTIIAKAQIDYMGIYIPLITISTVLLLNQDADSIKTIKENLIKTLITSSAAVVIIILCGFLREFLGFGSLFGFDLYTKFISPIGFFATSAGGLLTLSFLSAVYALLIRKEDK
ncbi:MAG: hypothetical protein J6Q56_02770 [Clostridia bacterium]|nr:hypothetical protein [Clostridia bacterium]